MRIHSHAAFAFRSEVRKVGTECAFAAKQFLRFITAHPAFEHMEMVRVTRHTFERNLVGAPSSFDWFSVHCLGSGPTFRRAQNQKGPDGSVFAFLASRFRLDSLDLSQHFV